MKTIDKIALVFGGLLFAILLTATQPVGYFQFPVTQYTNDWTLYFGGDPTVSNHITFQQKRIWIKSSAVVTNDASTYSSNEFIRGALITVPVYASITVPTNNDYNAANLSTIIVTNCSTNAMVFTGFTNGIGGQVLNIINMTGTNMAFWVTNSLSVVQDRINLFGVNTYTTNTTGQGSATFIYDGFSSNWCLVNIVY